MTGIKEPIPPMTDADRGFIPPAVARAAAAADALLAGNPPGNPPAPPAPPAPTTPPSDPLVVPAALPSPPAPLATPPTPPAPPATPPTPGPEATDAEVDAFLATPSEPNSEMARMQQTIRSMRGRLSAADKRVSTLLSSPPPVVATPQVVIDTPAEIAPLQLSTEIVEQYGEDLIGLISTVANDAAARARADVLKQVAPALSGVATAALATRQTDAKRYVDQQLAPYGRNFDSVDTDENFVNWLKLTDMMTGATRNSLFMDAWHKADAGRLAYMMTAYLTEVAPPAAPAPAPAPAPAAPPAPVPRQVVPLVTLAAPGRAANPTPPPATPGGDQPTEYLTRQQIRDFYAKKLRGEFVGREQEVAETERLIAQEIAANRVIG